MTHVLVTGSTGFIGTRLCGELTRLGFKVTGIARTQKPTRKYGTEDDNNKDIGINENGELKTINCDISDHENLLDVISSLEPIDCVFHLAGQTYRKDNLGPHVYFQNNFNGTLNLLECCRLFNIRKFILSSTIAVYGLAPGQYTPKYIPVDENHEAKPYDFYDLSKHFSEKLCEYYHQRFGIDCVVLRYSRIYGPGTEKALVFQATKKALSNSPIEVLGDISTDFVYIDDVVRANVLSLKISGFEIFNIGSGRETTLDEICRRIINLTSSSSEIHRQAEPKSRFSLNISKARDMLGYEPSLFDEALTSTISAASRG